MTDNDIIKTLECCVKIGECEKCLYETDYPDCDVIALINRQKAEIERLKVAFENLQKATKYWKDKCAELVEEVHTTKAEAITELVHRAIDVSECKDIGDGTERLFVSTQNIKKIAKEMKGGGTDA